MACEEILHTLVPLGWTWDEGLIEGEWRAAINGEARWRKKVKESDIGEADLHSKQL